MMMRVAGVICLGKNQDLNVCNLGSPKMDEKEKGTNELDKAKTISTNQLLSRIKELESYHRSDCNCLLDDESDEVLYDYRQCTCPSWQQEVNGLEARIKKLEGGIEELIAYGMPPHIEEGLKKLVEKSER